MATTRESELLHVLLNSQGNTSLSMGLVTFVVQRDSNDNRGIHLSRRFEIVHCDNICTIATGGNPAAVRFISTYVVASLRRKFFVLKYSLDVTILYDIERALPARKGA